MGFPLPELGALHENRLGPDSFSTVVLGRFREDAAGYKANKRAVEALQRGDAEKALARLNKAGPGTELAVVVDTVLGSHFGWLVNSPPTLGVYFSGWIGMFTGGACEVHPFHRLCSSGWIGMFTGGTIRILTHPLFD